MSNLNSRQRGFYYNIISERDGEFCWKCQKTRAEVGMLEIHEIQHTKPLDSNFMRLLCHSCNHDPALKKQEIISQRDHSLERRKKLEAEPYYEDWLYGELMLNNWHMPFHDAVENGAYNCGISIVTAKRYLRKLTAKDAPYTTQANQFGIYHIWLKSKIQPNEPKYLISSRHL